MFIESQTIRSLQQEEVQATICGGRVTDCVVLSISLYVEIYTKKLTCWQRRSHGGIYQCHVQWCIYSTVLLDQEAERKHFFTITVTKRDSSNVARVKGILLWLCFLQGYLRNSRVVLESVVSVCWNRITDSAYGLLLTMRKESFIGEYLIPNCTRLTLCKSFIVFCEAIYT